MVEPFAGGMAVALGLLPKRALLNDINPHLINFYQHLRAGLKINIDDSNDEKTYYANRLTFNSLIQEGKAIGMHADGKRAAMLFYYLNRHCYNGLCRFNRSGEFNTPFGTYVNPKFEKDLTQYAPILAAWEFSAVDFAEIKFEPNDFVYADPPYDDAFTGYSKDRFGYAQQKLLAEKLAELECPVVLSNHATDDMLKLYRELGFDVSRRYEAPRMIHCFGDRTPALEVLAVRNL